MKNLIYIFLGGGVGSVMRYLISGYTQKIWNMGTFPLGTFLVNITGCFLIGLLTSYFMREDSYLKFLLIAGFCGGFTTFSTFSAEGYQLLQTGSYTVLAGYIILSIIAGLAAVYGGFRVGDC